MLGLRINEIEVTPAKPARTHRFLKGPIPWMAVCTAASLPGQALAVFLAIHHRVALTGNPSVTIPKHLLAELGVSRDAKARALRSLQEASLITVERANGRSARIKMTLP
ncbi:hypothetical protein [Bradyrhizobium elkanii]|uniref:hypothetical protein n=1 Tax=Bradyrhizobium elkanii TaxID=29448 RepID=UPI00209ECC12|nr:hypothetical protein [Bradyrhizobium elkanii]MCP1974303.1 hypothetical protein [Bradyrhizobium elkanii]MCS4104192.1 hypothetical protein [Bradyrhizobium elkanii]